MTKFELAKELRSTIARAVVGVVTIEMDKEVMKLRINDNRYNYTTLVWYEHIVMAGVKKVALDILNEYMREIARKYIQLEELASLSMSASGNEFIYTF